MTVGGVAGIGTGDTIGTGSVGSSATSVDIPVFAVVESSAGLGDPVAIPVKLRGNRASLGEVGDLGGTCDRVGERGVTNENIPGSLCCCCCDTAESGPDPDPGFALAAPTTGLGEIAKVDAVARARSCIILFLRSC